MSDITLSSEEKRIRLIRVIGLCVLAFTLMLSYALARPAVESIFLQQHSYKSLPIVWLFVAAGALFTTLLYNQFASRIELVRLFALITTTSALLLLGLIFATKAQLPGSTYALYIWKDLYIVVLVETFWSFSNAVFPLNTAKWVYGTFCMMGSLGGIAGNLLVGRLARSIGTNNVLWVLFPLLLLIGAGCFLFAKFAGYKGDAHYDKEPPNVTEGFQIVRKSRYLLLMLLVIVATQIAITLIDYQFNQVIQQAYPQKDLRTDVIGKVYTAIAIVALVLESSTGLILRFLGVSATFLLLPALLGFAVGGAMLVPLFLTMAIAKVTSKSLDYSVFRASKELLYLPLGYKEKTQGKAVVDIMTYRVAKGLASLLVLTFTTMGWAYLVPYFTPLMIGVWFVLAWLIIQRYTTLIQAEANEVGD
ncbi:MAG: hypothetical protein CL920_11660 [Deltaproteobacteria bacterium]|nr:hypothetical protein [Deltaproteobacteria bacterium]|tara:strand:- start:8250 stop:9506 length:1257 start_codon:yes stop_codon:yes gene_type:complete